MQVLHVETCQGILRHKLGECSVHRVLADMVDGQLQIGNDIDMSYIEPTAVRLSRILTWQMVIEGKMQAIDLHIMFAFLLC